ncbi:twin-arginine translocase subunit TatC [Paenibacillus sp. IB182496]|uniref:Sec-independent protein translocase protein TatC n=1 Tax=Paenibacillus sabuli TaxID=2772509 RepID=A0A927BXI9_9BACL|nr:twin-arginine translocase subunit TatC [Paenibacillus sabuli]MBD2847163.1 twin-arginine translocase subunit TatC [Paenibacillus sabuli]
MAVNESDVPSAADTAAKERRDRAMSIFDHIGELRKRLIAVLLVTVLGLVIGLIAAQGLYEYLVSQEPLNNLPLNALSPWDSIGIYMKIAFVIALIPALPFALLQVWRFVKPALGRSEQRSALRYVPFALLMLLLGFAFSYFVVFPMAFHFTSGVAERLGLVETYGVVQYFSFMFNIIVPISLLFELPIVMMFLTKLRIVNPLRLRKLRRIAYFLMVLVGTLITPPDVISDLLVAAPLILLYEFSIMLSALIYRKQLQADKAWEEEFGPDA